MNTVIMQLNDSWTLYYAENQRVAELETPVNTVSAIQELGFSSVPATVPGNFELDFEKAGLIQDPFFGRNPLQLQKFENLHSC